MKVKLLLLGGLLVGALAVPMSAWADPPGSGADYGRHVAACAQAMGGFTGDHNPGMHHGRFGWHGMSC